MLHVYHFSFKVGHLYKATFDQGCRDDVSIDAAIIKIQRRLPEKAEFIETKPSRLKSAGNFILPCIMIKSDKY